VYSEKIPDAGQRNCPKYVEFYSKNKNKFEKLVYLVGFIIRIYHGARSTESHIVLSCLVSSWLRCVNIQISNTSYVYNDMQNTQLFNFDSIVDQISSVRISYIRT